MPPFGDLVAVAQLVLSLHQDTEDMAAVLFWLSDMQGKSNPIFASSKNDNTANSGGSFNSNHSTLLFPSNAVTKVRRVVGDLYEGIKNRLVKTVEWDSNIPSGSGAIWYLW